jgi:RNA polymerase sigma-70 factor, ECF subfamily
VRDRDGVESKATIEQFYRDHARDVLAYLVWLTRDPERAEDLMHDTFVKATRSLGGYRGGSPRSWLFAIARSVFLDDTRRRRPVPVVDVDEARSDPDVAEVDAVRRVLATLPEAQRSALLLRDLIGLPYAEVAEALGKSVGATKVLIHRARAGFRARYEEGG